MANELPIANVLVHDDELSNLKDNVALKLWTKPHMSHINAYRSNSVGGQGLVLAIPKSDNEALVKSLEGGRETWIEVEGIGGEVRFRAFHLTQEHVDRESDAKRSEFLEDISKPYHPRTTTKAWLRTIADTPFEEGMTLELIRRTKEQYIQNLGHPVSFASERLDRPAHVIAGAPSRKIIRAALSGYDASATVVLTHTGALISQGGVSGRNQTAQVVISFVAHSNR
jgi:hypothetical protein